MAHSRDYDIEPLGTDLAKLAGQALARSRAGPGSVDAVVMASAASRGDVVLTSYVEDLEALRVFFLAVRVLGV